jgi:hypothetical protein
MRQLARGKDRRSEPRDQSARPVYVESADPRGDQFEEVRTTRDLSRWGLYFVTEKTSYWAGMRVHVIPAFGCFNLEYEAEVVRVEQLGAGEFGVALRLICIRDSKADQQTASRCAFQSFAMANSPLEPHEPNAVLGGNLSLG